MNTTKSVIIVEGPNGSGKDVFITKVLEYCPYYKIHYAASDIVNEVKGQEHLLPLMTYTAFETIYSSIKRDTTPYPHIQYRSPLTNLIYNRILRPTSSWLDEDRMYLDRFLSQKYTSEFKFWIMTYDKDYLENQFRENAGVLADRLRGRARELSNLVTVNNMYEEEADRIASKTRAFKLVRTRGKGSLDIINAMDEVIDKTVKFFGTYPLVLIDSEYLAENPEFSPIMCDDRARFIFISSGAEAVMRTINSTNFRYLPKEKYALLLDVSNGVLNYDFFLIYSIVNIVKKKQDTIFVTDKHTKFYIERKLEEK